MALGITTTMSWVTIGTTIVVVLLALNSAFVILRRRKRGESSPDYLRSSITPTGMGLYGLFTIALLAGYAAWTVAPESQLGLWIARHGVLTYLGLCWIAQAFVGMALHLLGFPSSRRNGAA